MTHPGSGWRAGALVVGLTILCAAACSSKAQSPTSPTIEIRSEAGESAINEAVTSAWKYIHSFYDQSISGSAPAGAPATATLPSAQGSTLAAADDVTCANLVLKYFTAAGSEQASYNPVTTSRVTAQGVCSVSGTPAIVDLTLDDVSASSPTLVANGTVQGTYRLLVVTAQVKDLRVPKQTCAYPISGQIIGRAADITVTAEFDGSATAKATYAREGSSVTYYVQMPGC